MTSPLTVAGRFCGPPGIGNGGYVAGRLAALVGGGTVTVRLRRPTPLERELTVRRDGTAVDLLDHDELLARAEPAELDLDLPHPPSAAAAAAAAAALPARTGHPFPGCFGCGPARRPGDAVRALVGPLPGRPHVWAGTWRAAAGLPAEEGRAAPETVWAALDCPSYQPVSPEERPHLLASLTVAQERPVEVGTEVVLLAWVLGRDGRRATSASALIGGDGQVRARARAVWVAVG